MTNSTVSASPAGRRVFNDILGGTAASVLTIAYGLSYSLLIFAGPLAPYLGIGIGITFTVSAGIARAVGPGRPLPLSARRPPFPPPAAYTPPPPSPGPPQGGAPDHPPVPCPPPPSFPP